MISRAIAVPAQPAFGIGNSGGARTDEAIDVSLSEQAQRRRRESP